MEEIVQAKNGALRDVVTGRFVPGGKVTTAIADPSQAREYVQRKLEKKRERVQAGANAAVREKLPNKFDGADGDYIEAIAQSVAEKALDRLDPKQVDAARFIFSETGVAEPKAGIEQGARVTFELGADALQAVLQALGSDKSNYHKQEVVDAQAEPIANDEE